MNAIITGAAGGIGKAVALNFASEEVNLGLCDIDEESLAKTVHEIRLRNENIGIVHRCLDVSDVGKILDFTAECEKRLGGTDILVNNVGLYILHAFEDISTDEWDRVLSVNLRSFFSFTQSVLAGMKKRNFGRIINISSAAGKNGGTVCGAHYAASKGAILSFTRHLAKQAGAFGVTVNAVAPGAIATAMVLGLGSEDLEKVRQSTVVGRLGLPEDVARVVRFLTDADSGFITGETINVNGGSLMD